MSARRRLAGWLKPARPRPQLLTGIVMALRGVALVLGCLFAFPYAGVWHEDRPTTPEDHRKFVNDIRTMLISIVVGAFRLVTIYLTLVSAQATTPASGWSASPP